MLYGYEWDVLAALNGVPREDWGRWSVAVHTVLMDLDMPTAAAAAPMVMEWFKDPDNLGTEKNPRVGIRSPFAYASAEVAVIKKKREQRSEDYGWQGLD